MFLLIALVLLSVGIGFFVSIYSTFFPFLQNISSITEYNSAYYSALGSIERASLVLKYRDPGFEGSGGSLGSTGWGPLSDQTAPFLTGDKEGMRRIISSRTTSIPAPGDGNTDIMLRAPDSDMYNMIDYHSLEIFPLSMDTTTGGELYYSGDTHNLSYFSGEYISGAFRLPSVVYQKFGSGPIASICATNDPVCDPDASDVYDKEMVNRGLSGIYTVEEHDTHFTVIPTSDIFETGGHWYVNYPYDNLIRASVINSATQILFDETPPYSPVATNGGSLTGHTVVASGATGMFYQSFGHVFQNIHFYDLQLFFGLASWLRSYQGSLYPYLEYRFTFPQEVSDRFFTIDAHGRNRNYDVQILLKKPTVDGTAGGGFTIVF